MNSYLNAMRNYANFDGRTTRSQFWFYILVLAIIFTIALIIEAALDLPVTDKGVGVFSGLILLAHMLPTYAIQARRLHDSNKSGWMVLLSFVPVVGALVLLVLYCQPSTPGRNQYDEGSLQGGFPQAPTTATSPVLAPTLALATSSSSLEKLEKLASLKASGALDDAEFQRLKADIIGKA